MCKPMGNFAKNLNLGKWIMNWADKRLPKLKYTLSLSARHTLLRSTGQVVRSDCMRRSFWQRSETNSMNNVTKWSKIYYKAKPKLTGEKIRNGNPTKPKVIQTNGTGAHDENTVHFTTGKREELYRPKLNF